MIKSFLRAFFNPEVNQLSNENLDNTAEWVRLFYNRIDQNLSITRTGLHESHQWAITLGIGIVTAIISLQNNETPFPNEMSLLALILTFPILLRFFIRSCIEYSIQEKFNLLRNEIDFYLLEKIKNKENFSRLISCVQTYYYDFKCPTELWKIVKTNLLLSYLWIFIVYIGLIVWNIFTVQAKTYLFVCGGLSAFMVIFEITQFCSYRGFKFQEWPNKRKIIIEQI